ncbi:DNA translocase FtsK [Lysinibacillus capsici]|uniref:FtsK/SpoIIIE family DNA translocase n=1 Tax=Lysinibacillus capsici TaxID=2115968 RepID=UPI002E1CC46C|nr:DNA translocase FtsK [Lysinibacillus capsici]
MAVSKRKKVTKSKATTEKKDMHPLMYEILGLLLIALAVIMVFEYGMIGRILQTIAMFLFGNLHFAVPFMLIFVALLMMIGRKKVGIKDRLILGMFLIVMSLTIFSHGILFEQLSKSGGLLSDSVLRESWRILINTDGIIHRSNALGGGMIGALLFSGLHVLFEASGAKVVAWVIFFIGLILVTGKALVPYLAEKTPDVFGKWKKKHRDKKKNTPKKPNNRRSRVESGDEVAAVNQSIDMPEQEEEIPHEPIISAFTQNVSQEREVLDTTHLVENELEEATDDVQIQGTDAVENADYQLPSYNLLQLPPQHDQSGEYSVIQANAKKLEQTLQSFGVKAKVTQVHLGPAVTKYEILPDIGVKVSKIVNLQDDLALALAAKDIRMEAPIPGKSAIGIEVPNSEVAIVTLREVLESKDGAKPEALLQVAFGRDITGQAVLAELNKMPHLLVAGSTGSGKSVCINGIVVSILMRTKPHEVKLMMIDPKMVELNVYNGIPHLLAPVVTDARKASQALKKVVSEMERRYDLFSHTGTRNIEGYNAHVQKVNDQTEEKHPKLPYIVVIVDELADLMMVASSDVEDSITRLAQMARAAGIHLIIATQRPSVDVLTGVIKANIPSRIAFAVSSAIDSRTILDMGGAERLLGRGDMLFLPAGASKPKRVQGAFLSDQEVEAVVHFVIEQQKAQYQEEMIPTEEETILEETDDLYDEAVQLVVNMQTASVSMLQRRFRIGYSRAARIVDQMEQRGIVGPPEGSKPRQVLVHQYDN